MNLPKLIGFDLDGTVWTPDMYQLWGGGAPFTIAPNGIDLIDRRGTSVKLLGNISSILHELQTDPELSSIKVAWVSCTDEPEWANECLQKFKTTGRSPIGTCSHSSQIFQAYKQVHFQKLRQLYPEIDYSQMLFFDNEYRNIEAVSELGVKCVYCPRGVTQEVWESGLALFHVNRE
jgi:magnesium-dependent phosphatase 1